MLPFSLKPIQRNVKTEREHIQIDSVPKDLQPLYLELLRCWLNIAYVQIRGSQKWSVNIFAASYQSCSLAAILDLDDKLYNDVIQKTLARNSAHIGDSQLICESELSKNVKHLESSC